MLSRKRRSHPISLYSTGVLEHLFVLHFTIVWFCNSQFCWIRFPSLPTLSPAWRCWHQHVGATLSKFKVFHKWISGTMPLHFRNYIPYSFTRDEYMQLKEIANKKHLLYAPILGPLILTTISLLSASFRLALSLSTIGLLIFRFATVQILHSSKRGVAWLYSFRFSTTYWLRINQFWQPIITIRRQQMKQLLLWVLLSMTSALNFAEKVLLFLWQNFSCTNIWNCKY